MCKKVGRPKCEKKFNSLGKVVWKAIRIHVPHYVQSTPVVRYRMNPYTYLNGSHWEDEIIGVDAQSQVGAPSKGGREMVY